MKTDYLFNNIFYNKRVLVTGHTGFKGSWLCSWLSKLNAKIAGISVDIPTQPSLFEALNLSNEIEDYRIDIRDVEEIEDVFSKFQPEVVFHLAAKPIVRQCYDHPKEAFETNVLGTINMLECLKKFPDTKAGIFITSDKCYNNVEWEYGYRENDSIGGKDPYSASKACAELSFSSYYSSYFLNSNTKIATVRAGNVVGGGDWAESRVVPDCIKAWSQNDKAIVRNPNSTRPWQHVLEPLSGYLTLSQNLLESKSNLSGESFNFGPSSDVIQPVSELITEMQKIWSNHHIQLDANKSSHKKEANLLKLCCDKALSILDWQALLSFEETIHATSTWYYNFYVEKKNVKDITMDQINWYENLAKERNAIWAKK